MEEEPNWGESVQINCYVTKGDMPINFSWNFNGKTVTDQLMSIDISPYGKKSSILSIDSIDESYMGNYTCIATNKAGSSSYTMELFVKGMKK